MSGKGSEAIGTALKSALAMGALMRLAIWCKMGSGRKLSTSLEYFDKKACWLLALTEKDVPVFNGTSESFDGVVFMAVSALGKSR